MPRIVSLDLCSDWLLAHHAPDSQSIVFSPMVRRYPLPVGAVQRMSHDGSLEQVLALKPDVVLVGEFNAFMLRKRLASLGVRVVITPLPQTLVDLESLDHVVQTVLEKSNAPNGPNGEGMGRKTFEDNLITRAGWVNYVESIGRVKLDLEAIAVNPPDALVLSVPRHAALANLFVQHPVLKHAIPPESVSLTIGSVPLDVWSGLHDWLIQTPSPEAIVVGEIRLPRTLLALLVGASLGLSGAALQGLLRNPLADPGLTGASQGAALGAATVFYFGFFSAAGVLAPALAGFMGAVMAMVFMLWLAGTAQASMVLLAGLAISTITGALLATVLNFAPNPFAMQELVFWLLGSVSDRGMQHVLLLLPSVVLGLALLWRERPFLAAISLGEQVAHSLGYRFAVHSRWVVLGAALLVGSAVSVAGSVGFVGLIVPHLLRRWVGHRPDRLLIPSALLGACLVCVADTLVRLLPSGPEIKLGVITALIGSPLFIRLIWNDRKQWQG
eukprot:gene22227-27186_t